MDYAKEYEQKLVSAEEAVKVIKSGDWVDYGWCNATVDALDKALAKRTDELKDINLRGGILLKTPAVFEREDSGEHFTWNSWHMSGIERKLIARGCAYYAPIRYSELPRYYRESDTPDDVAMFQVSPMDAHGYFNFGPNASHMMAVCETSKKIIVEVNQNMPRCLGGFENSVHISEPAGGQTRRGGGGWPPHPGAVPQHHPVRRPGRLLQGRGGGAAQGGGRPARPALCLPGGPQAGDVDGTVWQAHRFPAGDRPWRVSCRFRRHG